MHEVLSAKISDQIYKNRNLYDYMEYQVGAFDFLQNRTKVVCEYQVPPLASICGRVNGGVKKLALVRALVLLHVCIAHVLATLLLEPFTIRGQTSTSTNWSWNYFIS